MTRPASSTARTILVFIVFVVLGAATAAFVMPPGPQFHREATIRAGVSEDLLLGYSRGRQGLIGSLYWSPLPTLLALPMFRLPKPLGGEWTFLALAILSGAGLATALSDWLRRNGAPWWAGMAAAAAVFASPLMRRTVLEASSGPLFALLLFGTFCFLLHWLNTRHLRSLAYLSLCLMLAVTTRYQAALIGAAVFGIVTAALLMRYRPRHYVEGTLVVLVAPAVYAALLWIIANWLIMGDAWFFMRGLRPAEHSLSEARRILTDGCDWRLIAAAALAALLPWVAAKCGGRRGAAAGVVAAFLALIPFWMPASAETAVSDPAGWELRNAVAPVLRTQYREDWIVLSGYRGYEIGDAATGRRPENVQHVLSFYLAPVLADTHHRRAYLLTPKPDGPDRWEDINLKYPTLYEEGAPFVVFERTWDHWRLWRIVRLDETDRR
jgi:hypothetical protein